MSHENDSPKQARSDLPRAVHELLGDLDSSGPAEWQSASDAQALIGRAMNQRLDSPVARVARPQRSRWRVTLAVAALVLTGGGAMAAWFAGALRFGATARPPEPSRYAPAVTGTSGTASVPGSRASQDHAAESQPEVGSGSGAPSDPVQRADSGLSKSPRPTASGRVTSAAPDLLAQANKWRREGKLLQARDTYLQLVRDAPTSAAAYVARVAAAQLMLSSKPSRAVVLLREARRQSPSGPLDRELRETLVRAYHVLGEREAEERELRALVQRYPEGAGVAAERKRLNDLQK